MVDRFLTLNCNRNRVLFFSSLVLFFLGSTASAGSILYGGLEDYAGGAGIEKNGDFNDLVFKMAGDITVVSPDAAFSPLTSSMIDESGNIYWDQRSLDGPKYNLGYCVLGGGSCPTLGPSDVSYESIAGAGGTAPTSILFDAQGPITIDYALRMTAGSNSLGWYDPSNPSVLHPIFSSSNGPGTSVVFTPSGVFALYSVNVFGQFFSTAAAANVGESATQQHFAFISDPPNSAAPEPKTTALISVGLVVLFLKRFCARQRLG
jgi:hypothetical protein